MMGVAVQQEQEQQALTNRADISDRIIASMNTQMLATYGNYAHNSPALP